MISFPFFSVLRRYALYIIATVGVAAFLAASVVYEMPDFYRAHAELMAANNDARILVVAKLKSDALYAAVARRAQVDETNLRRAQKVVADVTTSVIDIRVEWSNPDTAALLANAFVYELQDEGMCVLNLPTDECPIKTDKTFLTVIQWAVPPQIASGPARENIVFLTIVISFAVSLFMLCFIGVVFGSKKQQG